MAYFHFEHLIRKYQSDFTLLTFADGQYDDKGEWVPGASTEVLKKGAVMGITENKIYQSAGALTEQDKHLYMLEPIDRALTNAKVRFDGNVYSIEEETGKDNSKFSGVYTYVLKWVSHFV